MKTKTVTWLLLTQALISHAADVTKLQRLGEDDLTAIRTKLKYTTLILLAEGEELKEVTCGDADSWVVEGSGRVVYVKPSRSGAQTNINIVTKSGGIYSLLLQEVSKPGSKEKFDLQVLLGGDELAKLRKDKENVEQLLTRTENDLRKAKEQEAEAKEKKRDEAKSVSQLEKIHGGGKAAPPQVGERPDTHVQLEPTSPIAGLSRPLLDEQPIATAYVVEPNEGLLRRGGRVIGRFLRRFVRALRVY